MKSNYFKDVDLSRVRFILKWFDEYEHEVGNKKYDDICNDLKLMKLIRLDLAQIGEHLSHLPDEIKAYLNKDQLLILIRARNLIIHEYEHVDFIDVWDTVQKYLIPFMKSYKSMPFVKSYKPN